MSDTNSTQQAAAEDDLSKPAGWDNLADDLIGFNYKGLRSLKDLVLKPRAYFHAARSADWLGKYMPSLKLVLALAAMTTFLRFLWAGTDSAMTAGISTMLTEMEAFTGIPGTPQMADDIITKWLLMMPFAYVFFHGLASLCVFIWEKRTPAPVRMRLYFACLVPSGIAGLIMVPLLAALPDKAYLTFSNLSLLLLFAIYAVTCWRGIGVQASRIGRTLRALLFGTIAIFVGTLMSTITMGIAYIWQIQSLAPAA